MKFFSLIFLVLCSLITSNKYSFTLVHGGGCPYTASWLIHMDLFHLVSYRVTWQKMETVTWDVIKAAKYNFQFVNESSYFVHHMSQFEHYHRKKSGYAKSENITKIYSEAAMKEVCWSSFPHQSDDKDAKRNPDGYHQTSIGLIPFYGGRPPNVTADLQVKSLGQGNSLVRQT